MQRACTCTCTCTSMHIMQSLHKMRLKGTYALSYMLSYGCAYKLFRINTKPVEISFKSAKGSAHTQVTSQFDTLPCIASFAEDAVLPDR